MSETLLQLLQKNEPLRGAYDGIRDRPWVDAQFGVVEARLFGYFDLEELKALVAYMERNQP